MKTETQPKPHTGLFYYRLEPDQDNPREVAFAEAWREENRLGNVLKHLVPGYTSRDEQVAATVIQWLGSNVGMAFIRDVVRANPQIAKWLNPEIK